ncbi:unnamed protein product [Durusdinium trenchii]|uniref:Uncharacterized protein n=1 Tax=Durusdinium trenchii TaxID=1381693 RepID=A0ABP0MNW3_9DINO
MAQPVDPFAKWRLLTTPSEQFKDCTPSGSELRFSFFLKEVLRHPLSFEDFIDFRRSNSFLRENTSKKSHGFDAAAFRTDFASQLENQVDCNSPLATIGEEMACRAACSIRTCYAVVVSL